MKVTARSQIYYRIMQYLIKRGLTRSQANTVRRKIFELVRQERHECAALLAHQREAFDKRVAALREENAATLAKALSRRFPLPPIGKPMLCLVCAYEKPWGIFDEKTGAAVCVGCRDAAQRLNIPLGCADGSTDTVQGVVDKPPEKILGR